MQDSHSPFCLSNGSRTVWTMYPVVFLLHWTLAASLARNLKDDRSPYATGSDGRTQSNDDKRSAAFSSQDASGGAEGGGGRRRGPRGQGEVNSLQFLPVPLFFELQLHDALINQQIWAVERKIRHQLAPHIASTLGLSAGDVTNVFVVPASHSNYTGMSTTVADGRHEQLLPRPVILVASAKVHARPSYVISRVNWLRIACRRRPLRIFHHCWTLRLCPVILRDVFIGPTLYEMPGDDAARLTSSSTTDASIRQETRTSVSSSLNSIFETAPDDLHHGVTLAQDAASSNESAPEPESSTVLSSLYDSPNEEVGKNVASSSFSSPSSFSSSFSFSSSSSSPSSSSSSSSSSSDAAWDKRAPATHFKYSTPNGLTFGSSINVLIGTNVTSPLNLPSTTSSPTLLFSSSLSPSPSSSASSASSSSSPATSTGSGVSGIEKGSSSGFQFTFGCIICVTLASLLALGAVTFLAFKLCRKRCNKIAPNSRLQERYSHDYRSGQQVPSMNYCEPSLDHIRRLIRPTTAIRMKLKHNYNIDWDEIVTKKYS